MTETPQPYDEERIEAGLGHLSADRRAAFACAMGEVLMPTATWLTNTTNRDDAPALRAALDVAWKFVNGESPSTAEIKDAGRIAEALVPDEEDEDWTLLSPLLQNSAASVAYALATCVAASSQEAVWAARQVHEAADFLLQLTAPAHSYVDDPTSEPIVIAVRAIQNALIAASVKSPADLQATAASDGRAFLRLLDPQ